MKILDTMHRGEVLRAAWGRRWIFAVILLCIAPALPTMAQDRPVFRIGGDKAFPPFEMTGEDGRPRGFNVDLLQSIATDLDFDVDIGLGHWREIYDAFLAGDLDAVPMYLSDERASRFLFTDPVTIIYHKIVVRSDEPNFRSLADLQGHTVLVESRSWAESYLAGESPGALLMPVASESEALRLLASGRADAAFVSGTFVRWVMHREPDSFYGLRVSSPPLGVCEYAIAVRPDLPELRDLLNQGLSRLRADGRLENLMEQWLAPPVDFHIRFRDALRRLIWGVLALLGFAALAAAWSMTLRRQVKARTAELRAKNRLFRTLSRCNEALIHETDETDLLNAICRLIVVDGEFTIAWVGLVNEDEDTILPAAAVGINLSFLQSLKLNLDAACTTLTGQAFRSGQPAEVADIRDALDQSPWAREAQTHGARSMVCLPMRAHGQRVGLLNVCSSRTGAFSPDETAVLMELASDMAFGLLTIRTRKERDQARDQFMRQARIYHQLVDDMPGLICRFKPDGTLTFVNDEYCRYFSKEREELIGKSFIPLIPDEDKETVREAFASCGASSPVVDYEHRVIMGNGEIRWMRWIDRALLDEAGAVSEYQSIGLDISERKALEAQIQHSQKMEIVGMLAGGIAHDFNNALQVIQGFAELAKDAPSLVMGKSPDDGAERNQEAATDNVSDMDDILKAVFHAQRLTRQLLLFSRKQPLHKERFDLNELLRHQKKMLRRLLGEDMEICNTLSPAPLHLFADYGQVEQIVMNLAVNARDAMPNGGRLTLQTETVVMDEVLRLHATDFDMPPGDYACLSITDTGTGITPDVLQRIFEPFYSTKERGRGTGLGLSTSYGIAKAHGGGIAVYSEWGQGSTFKVYLPLAGDTPTAESRPVENKRAREQTRGRILLVEDDEAIAGLAARTLSKAGHSVDVAFSIAAARDMYERKAGEYDLIFSDMELGDGRGMDLVDAFRERKPRQAFLFTTGYADERSRWEELERRGFACLHKPYAADMLLDAVCQEIRRSTLRDEK